jgi:hypothetical protein
MLKCMLIFTFLIIFISCSNTNDPKESFSGITVTNETCEIQSVDKDDWRKWRQINLTKLKDDTQTIASDTSRIIEPDTNFIAIVCPNPARDIFELKYSVFNSNEQYVISIHGEPGILYSGYLTSGNYALSVNTEGLTAGIHRIYIRKIDKIGNKFETYGDVQVIK